MTSTAPPASTIAQNASSPTNSTTHAPPTKASSGPPAVVGHGKSNEASAMNGKPVVISANGPSEEHTRKVSVNLPLSNGAPSTSTRPNMQFGSMTAGESPAVSNSIPVQTTGSPSMAHSNSHRVPSPIPPSTNVTGGRPPSGPPSATQLSFGSFSANNSDPNASTIAPKLFFITLT
jgi:translation initiation factor 4G